MIDIILIFVVFFIIVYGIKFLLYLGNEFERFCKETVHDIKHAVSKTYREQCAENERNRRIGKLQTRIRNYYASERLYGPHCYSIRDDEEELEILLSQKN